MSTAASAAATARTEARDCRAAARAYEARGWRVVPLARAEKIPTAEKWQTGRYTAEDVDPDAGVGILLGKLSGGLQDVDPDVPEAAAAWEHYRPVATGMRHRRMTGYIHDWYVVDEAPDKTERLQDPDDTTLIELRSTGGQTVVPPSINPSGERLGWVADGEPAHVDLAELQRAVRHTAAAAMLARRYPGEGSRHDYRLALAGMLLRGGLSTEDAERLMCVSARIAGADAHDAAAAVRDTAAALAAGKRATGCPSLAERLPDAERVCAKLRKWLGLRESAAAFDDDSPPLDLWGNHLAGLPALDPTTVPSVLGDLAQDVATRHGCDPALFALPALGVCAGAIDDRHQLQPRQHDTEWRAAPRLWVTSLADVGAGKSPALAVAYRPLRAVDERWAMEDAGPRKRYALEVRAHNKALDDYVRRGAVGEVPPEPPRPPARRRVCEDITIEALSDVLADNPGGVLIAVDELAALIGSMDAYRPTGAAKDQPLYLQLYEGGPRLIERVKRGQVRVANWGASLVGAIQPDRLRKLADRITEDGLLARMVLFVAAEAADPIDQAPQHTALKRYTATVERLVALPQPHAPYMLAPEAHERREYVAKIARAVSILPMTSPAMRGHLAKWEGLYARLALTWHLTDCASSSKAPPAVIGEGTADAVARLMVGYLLPHAAYVYGEVLGQDHLAHARWIAGHILAHRLERLSARDIGRAYHNLRDDRRGLDDAMQTLTVAGWVNAVDSQPGRPPSRWRVNPRVHPCFAKRAETEQQRREAVRERLRAATELLGLEPERAA